MATTPVLWKSPFQVNTADTTTAYGGYPTQYDGQVVALADGGFLAFWTDYSHLIDTNSSTIVSQQLDAFGHKVGFEQNQTPLASDTGDILHPAIAGLGNGSYAFAYEYVSASGIHSVGAVAAFNLTLGAGTQRVDPAITVLSDGSAIASYTIGSGADTDIAAIVLPSEGDVNFDVVLFNDTDNSGNSELAALSNGNFVLVFEDEFNGSATNIDCKFGIFARNGSDVTTVKATNSISGAGGIETEIQPDVAALNGRFVVVWTDFTSTSTPNQDIRATIYNNDGTLSLANFLVNTSTTGAQNEASVVALKDGGFNVVWEDDFANVVRGQRFDAAGNKVGSEYVIKHGVSDVGPVNDSPDQAVLADGRVVVTAGDFSSGDLDVTATMLDPTLSNVLHIGDFNGDGKDDAFQFSGVGAGYVGASTGGVFTGYTDWGTGFTSSDRFGDFNADGRTDAFQIDSQGHGYVCLSNGTGFNNFTQWGSGFTASDRLGDFNADGRTDVFQIDSHGTGYVWLSNGTGFNSFATWGSGFTASDRLGDFNADGRTDVFQIDSHGTGYVWLSNGTGFDNFVTWGNGFTSSDRLGDFNGDGRTDVFQIDSHGTGYVWLSNGTGFNNFSTWGNGFTSSDRLGDFNGDGRTDVFQIDSHGTGYVWLSTGTGFDNFATWGSGFTSSDTVGDFNGDGKDDVVQIDSHGSLYVWLSNGSSFGSFANWTGGDLV